MRELPADLRLDAFDLVVTERWIRERSLQSIARTVSSTKWYRLTAHVTRTGYVLVFRTGLCSRVTLLVEPRTEALPRRFGSASERLALAGATDEFVREGKRYRFSFLARSYEPRVDREFPDLVASIAERSRGARQGGGRGGENTLLVRHERPDDLTLLVVLPRDRWITVESFRTLPVERRVLSTYAHLEVLKGRATSSSPSAGS